MSAIISSPHGPPQSREDGRCCNEPGEYCTDTAVFLCITCQGATGRAIISSTTLVVCCQEHPRWVRHLCASATAGPRRTKSCRRTEHPFFVSARRERGNEKQQPNMTVISFFFFSGAGTFWRGRACQGCHQRGRRKDVGLPLCLFTSATHRSAGRTPAHTFSWL